MVLPVAVTTKGAESESPQVPGTSFVQWLSVLGLLAAVLWIFWPTYVGIEKLWRTDPDQTHGYLVVPFVLYLLWTHRKEQVDFFEGWGAFWGMFLLIGGLGLRFAGVFVYLEWLQAVAIIPCLMGIGCLVWGPRRAMAHFGALVFLVFMVPLPYRIATGLAYPLQRAASLSSTYMLETFGFYASCIGTTIHIGDHALDVVAACSGMKILMTFFALSVAFALLNRQRPWWERLAIVIAAIPIALVANVVRIITTAVLYQMANTGMAKTVFHDGAGYLMMPVALLLLALWTWVLRICVVIDDGDVHQRARVAASS